MASHSTADQTDLLAEDEPNIYFSAYGPLVLPTMTMRLMDMTASFRWVPSRAVVAAEALPFIC